MRTLHLSFLALSIVCSSRAAMAAGPSGRDAAMAEALFQEAQKLMDQKNYEEACPKFAESQRLDPGTGTLLNLAVCHEKQGKVAMAWAEFNDALGEAQRDARNDRVQFAQQHIQAVEARLPKLTVTLSNEAAQIASIHLTLDGNDLGKAALGIATPVDPGEHTVEASAAGKQTFHRTVVLKESEQQKLDIPALENAPAAGSTTSTPPASGGGADVTADHGVERPITVPIYIAAGATIALGVGAGVTGLLYLNKRKDFNDINDAQHTDAEKTDARDSAKTMGLVSTVLTGGAVVGAVITGVLFVTRPEKSSTVALEPWTDFSSAGIQVRGTL